MAIGIDTHTNSFILMITTDVNVKLVKKKSTLWSKSVSKCSIMYSEGSSFNQIQELALAINTFFDGRMFVSVTKPAIFGSWLLIIHLLRRGRQRICWQPWLSNPIKQNEKIKGWELDNFCAASAAAALEKINV